MVVVTMRLLAITFAVVGILFIATPGGVAGRMEDVGDWFGDFAAPPGTGLKLWLALGFAYMTVITGLAWVVSTDVARYRPFLLVLAAGKAASSLATGAYFFFDVLNFLVDGSLVLIALWCWSLAGRVEPRTPG
jgi:hypothetical protein